MQAIVIKELRENLRWLPIGVLIIGVFVWLVTPTGITYTQTTTTDSITLSCSMGAALYAILLGALQSIFDLSDKQRGFLFHRSVSKNEVLYGKVIAGALLYSLACTIPLTCLALWFAWMGLEYLPVRPAQVIPSVLMCVACFSLHPATLVCVDRPARWFGTKLLPLVAVATSLLILSQMFNANATATWWLTLGLYLAFIVAVYCSPQTDHWTRKLLLIVGSAVAVVFCCVFVASCYQSIQNRRTPYVYAKIGLDKTGQLWYYRFRQVRDENGYDTKIVPLSGEPLLANKRPNLEATLPHDFVPSNLSHLRAPEGFEPQNRFASIDYFSNWNTKYLFYDNSGQMLLYEMDAQKQPPLSGVVTKDGFHAPGEMFGPKFTINPFRYGMTLAASLATEGYGLLSFGADQVGIYQFSPKSGAVTTILEMPIESAAMLPAVNDGVPRLLLLSKGNFHLYELVDEAGQTNWFEPAPKDRQYVIHRELPPLKLKELATFPAPPKQLSELASIAMTEDGKFIAVDHVNTSYATLDSSSDTEWQVTRFISPHSLPEGIDAIASAAVVPIGTFLVFVVSSVVAQIMAGRPPLVQLEAALPSADLMWVMIVVSILATSALAMVTYWLCQRRGLGRGTTVLWSIVSLFLGLATPLSIVAIYPKLVYEVCPSCQRPRRIDREKCPHCAAAWSSAPTVGIELLEGQALANRTDLHLV